MRRHATVYVLILLVFLAMDAVWLSLTATPLYRATLGDIMSSELRPVPALAFYLLYVVGLMVFVIPAGRRSGRARSVLGCGAFYGVVAYATYDLTNYATLRSWSLELTLVDMAWGGVVSGVASTVGYIVDRALSRR